MRSRTCVMERSWRCPPTGGCTRAPDMIVPRTPRTAVHALSSLHPVPTLPYDTRTPITPTHALPAPPPAVRARHDGLRGAEGLALGTHGHGLRGDGGGGVRHQQRGGGRLRRLRVHSQPRRRRPQRCLRRGLLRVAQRQRLRQQQPVGLVVAVPGVGGWGGSGRGWWLSLQGVDLSNPHPATVQPTARALTPKVGPRALEAVAVSPVRSMATALAHDRQYNTRPHLVSTGTRPTPDFPPLIASRCAHPPPRPALHQRAPSHPLAFPTPQPHPTPTRPPPPRCSPPHPHHHNHHHSAAPHPHSTPTCTPACL